MSLRSCQWALVEKLFRHNLNMKQSNIYPNIFINLILHRNHEGYFKTNDVNYLTNSIFLSISPIHKDTTTYAFRSIDNIHNPLPSIAIYIYQISIHEAGQASLKARGNKFYNLNRGISYPTATPRGNWLRAGYLRCKEKKVF